MTKSARVKGLDKSYPHYSWLQKGLLSNKPCLDYFSFANEVLKDARTTNSLYFDLLRTLTSQKQTKKVYGAASEALHLFQVLIVLENRKLELN
jgi:hypothetical protein